MWQTLNWQNERQAFFWHQFLPVLLGLLWMILAVSSAQAQGTFSSGSTGADGAFSPTASTTLQLPESGVFNFTTVTIPGNVTVKFSRNSRNTPVTILASGKVQIDGTIDVSGTNNPYFLGGQGGPGGFDGGRGGQPGTNNQDGTNGSGPGGGSGGHYLSVEGSGGGGGGGGYATVGLDGSIINGSNPAVIGKGGVVYGVSTLIPLIGGSGGGGGSVYSSGNGIGGSGGGGGGAIVIASSVDISGSGSIYARGGAGTSIGGGGSGGAIRLVANSLKGSLNFYVDGGSYAGGGGSGGAGYVRLESIDAIGFSPAINPYIALVSAGPPRAVAPANTPQLRIVSVAGVNAPTYISGSFNGPDIILPATQTGTVPVALAATNVPLTTKLQVVLVPQSGTPTTVQASALMGSQASSTATASVTLPTGPSLIYATAVIDLTLISSLAPLYLEGERVQKMEISAAFGSSSDVIYITESGKRIKRANQ